MRRVSIVLGMLGVAAAAALVLRFDIGDVLSSVISVGWDGAAILLAWQGLLFVWLGLAWHGVQPAVPARILIWGRMVRDAATACLPFSPVGGYVLGARAAALLGPGWTLAAAGSVVDASAELTGQFLFTMLGLAILVVVQPGSGLILPIAAAMLLIAAAGAGLWALRRRIGDVAQALGHRLLGDAGRAQGRLDALAAEMAALYARLPRLVLGVAMHLVGWLLTALGSWISLHLLGYPVSLAGIVALEALLNAAIAATFVVPAAAGVQEAGYVGLGTLFGVPPDIALSLSLLRRAREIAWGVPILGAWQWQEVRRL